MMNKKQSMILLSLLLLLFAIVNYFSFSEQPNTYPDYVSDSPSPSGVKAIYTYLYNEKGSKQWSHKPELLPKTEGNLLIMIEPTHLKDQQTTNDYLRFIEAGNTILLLQTNPDEMLPFNTVSVTEDVPVNSVTNKDHHQYQAEILSPMRLVPRENEEVLLSDSLGAVALKRPVGKGEIIVSITPEWIINRNLLSHDHLSLILELINIGSTSQILFDEYIHKGESTESYLTIYPKWLLLLLVQGIMITILWLWLRGKRFSKIADPREESVRFSDEGIRAITAWYVRGSRYHDSIKIQADYLKLALSERWGIPYSLEWKDLTGFLERKTRMISANEIPTFLKGLADILAKEKLTKQEFLLWSRILEQLRKEVEEG
ncbi:DUF4350 domain-containing protein [Bacillus sp. MRMR6]|uniref:DUF4350 domain-containing protein n=1 Tax=Bacillus sp. MRMR6 TaxID=1928617 RepID=UPI000951686F|nr:DUF4350 domain-containing protein [Bacillus sp. MRMR6]OLS38489.1 hypothetical protein BTR25_13780 [Bacillus sp. MRMR6]